MKQNWAFTDWNKILLHGSSHLFSYCSIADSVSNKPLENRKDTFLEKSLKK
jgi:hypothetical protein